MEFLLRRGGKPCRLGVLPGSFNPVTVAHLALGQAALSVVDEVAFVLPRQFPHKTYSGASFEQRMELLTLALADQPRFSAAVSDNGLFVEIAGECREAYGADVRLSFLCGRDAAERIVNWELGHPGAREMLREFDLLVGPARVKTSRRRTYWLRFAGWNSTVRSTTFRRAKCARELRTANPGNSWCRKPCANG